MKNLLIASSTLLLMGITSANAEKGGIPARVQALENIIAGLTSGSTEVTVNCGAGQTIGNAIAQAHRAAKVTITIDGTCTENVVIERDDVTVQGSVPGARSGTIVGDVQVISSNRVIVKDLNVINSNSVGFFALRSTSLRLINVSSSGHQGAAAGASRQSMLQIESSSFEAPSTAAEETIFASDGSTLRIQSSTVVSTRLDRGAIAVRRGANGRIDGGNTIQHSQSAVSPFQGVAITVDDNADLRMQGSGNVVIGNGNLSMNSTADVRNTVIKGNVQVQTHATLQLHIGGGVDGKLIIRRAGLLENQFSGSLGVTGTVDCSGGSAVSGFTGGLNLIGSCAVHP